MDDFKTDRDEAFFENEMSELIKHLEDEYRQSARGNWNKLRQLIFKHYFTQTPSQTSFVKVSGAVLNPKSETEKSYLSQRQRPPTPPLVQRTVIQVGALGDSASRNHGHFQPVREDSRPKSPTKVKFSSG